MEQPNVTSGGGGVLTPEVLGDGGLAAAGLAVAAARLTARWTGSGLAADRLGAGTAALFGAAWFVLPGC